MAAVRLSHPQLGLDSESEVPTSGHRDVGSSFALRYLSRSTGKVLTQREVENYRAAGIGVGVVFEDAADNALRGYDQGKADAEFAFTQAKALGIPAGRPIFFAVDFDPAGYPSRTDGYFDGVAAVLGHQGAGPYGGYEVVKHQFDRGFSWGWQTYAWSGSELDARAQLYQFSNDHRVAGVGVDYDHALFADFGQWDPPPAPDPDPHHYQWFPEGPFAYANKLLYERWLVQEYDRYRLAPHVGANSEMIGLLREDLTLARKRVWLEAHTNAQSGDRLPDPTWSEYHRGWRWQQLNARSQGERVV
ncbi:MAG TPA: DUF1906 domain-containing protein [Solirubrobacteraceae bacterium]|nr:DUF1906 domain-containing protein [Solirubrobacteraceae bacterium]